MSDSRHFEFFDKRHRRPYIEYLLDYDITGNSGCIHFGGYYYVMDEEFPTRIFFITTLYEDEPYEIKETKYGEEKKYRTIETKYYEVDIYKREILKNTSEYDEVDEDGGKMKICYFPTHEQKIYFKIINEYSSSDDFFNAAKIYFTEEQDSQIK